MADIVHEKLSSLYDFERPLAGAGMSRVYLATERALGRRVVVKVLSEDLAASVDVARFRREIQLAAQLQHPHIVPLLSADDVDGLLYYTMPFVEGESLKERLARSGGLSLKAGMRIVRDVLDALAYAHERGIVHRDIKPGNVLISGDHALVTDFGIAKALTGNRHHEVTATGLAIGTPGYMAPEQFLGDGSVDHRADVYAAGVLAYETLTGRHPYSMQTVGWTVMRGDGRRDSVADYPPDIAPQVAEVIARCMENDAGVRPQRIREVLDVFEHPPARIRMRSRKKLLVAAAAALAAVLLIAGALVPEPMRATALALLTRDRAQLSPKRVVVAPFDNETGDTAFNALGGMASDHITRGLMRTGLVEVVDARTSLLTSRMVELTPRVFRTGNRARALAEETGAGLVIWGSYYRHRDSLQFQAQITDVISGTVVRAVDAVSGGVYAKEELVEQLRLRTTAALAHVVDTALASWMTPFSPPPSYAGYREMVRGFESYIHLDMADGMRRMRLAASLDTASATPLLVLAYGLLDQLRWAEADTVIRRLEARRDQLVPAEQVWVDALRAWVRGDQGARLRAVREYQRLSPASSEIATLLARFATGSNRPREVIGLLENVDPRRGLMLVMDLYWMYLTAAHHQLGDHGEELRIAKRGRRQFPSRLFAFHSEARARAALGQTDDVRDLLGKAQIESPAQSSPAAAREMAAAWRQLERAFHLETIREVRAHGHVDESRRLADELVVTLQSEYGADTAARGRVLLLSTLYLAGRWDEAQAIAAELLTRDPSNVHYLGAAGCVAARRGDRAEASRVAALLAANREPYLFGRPTYYRARIASLLGDKPAAVRLLQQALSEGTEGWFPMPRGGRRQVGETNIHTDIDFEPLRDFAPFRQMLAPSG